MELHEIASALEAILFAAGDSVDLRRIAKVMGVEPWDVRQAAEKLSAEYEQRSSGLRLVRMEESLQLVTAPEHSDLINRCLEKRPQPKLSPTALEVLSIRHESVYRTGAGLRQLLYRGDAVPAGSDLSLRQTGGPRTPSAFWNDGTVFACYGHIISGRTAASAQCGDGRGDRGAAGGHRRRGGKRGTAYLERGDVIGRSHHIVGAHPPDLFCSLWYRRGI